MLLVAWFGGVLSQATKNKTYTPKNIRSSASKDCSHGKYISSLVLYYVNKEGGFDYNENNFKKKKTSKEQFKLKYRIQSKEQILV